MSSMRQRSDLPPTLPDTAVMKPLQAERIALRRLFDAALDVPCDIELSAFKHPQALNVLTEWGHEHGRSIEVFRHEGNADTGGPFAVYVLETGAGRIKLTSFAAVRS